MSNTIDCDADAEANFERVSSVHYIGMLGQRSFQVGFDGVQRRHDVHVVREPVWM